MKKLFYSFTLSVLAVFTLNAQQSTTLYDGEILSDGWSFLEGIAPNGSHYQDGGILTDGGKMDVHKINVPNPQKNEINNTDYVARSIRAKDGQNWFGFGLGNLNIDMSTVARISMLINKNAKGNSVFEIQRINEDNKNIYLWYSEEDFGNWKELSASIEDNPDVNFGTMHTLYIHLHHAEADFEQNDIIYWDEITIHYKDGNSQVVFNAESDPTFYSGWDTNGALNNIFTEQFPNLYKDDINNSENVIRFLRSKNGEKWCGIAKSIDELNFSEGTEYEVSVKINKAIAGNVAIKLERDGANGVEKTSNYMNPNNWENITITFSASDFSNIAPNALLIFPHAEATNEDGQNLNDHTAIYIDDIVIREKTQGNGTLDINTDFNSTPVSCKIYSITGRYVGDDEAVLTNGIYIKSVVYENAKTEHSKIYINKK